MTMTKASNADKKRQRRNDIEMNELANEPTSEQEMSASETREFKWENATDIFIWLQCTVHSLI